MLTDGINWKQMHTLEPSLGRTSCHMICIDRSVSSGSFPPTNVITAKHSSSYSHYNKSYKKQQIHHINISHILKDNLLSIWKIFACYAYRYCLCGLRARFKSLRNRSDQVFQYFMRIITAANCQSQ